MTLNFVSGLPITSTKKDFVWVIVDRSSKSAHFLPIRTDYTLQKLVKLYMSKNCEVVRGSHFGYLRSGSMFYFAILEGIT